MDCHHVTGGASNELCSEKQISGMVYSGPETLYVDICRCVSPCTSIFPHLEQGQRSPNAVSIVPATIIAEHARFTSLHT